MVLCIEKTTGKKTINITITQIGVGDTPSLEKGTHYLIAMQEVPNAEWAKELGELFAKLDPGWTKKTITIAILIPEFSLAH